MTSQTGKQTITVRILPNISRSKYRPIVKVGHLIEYIMRNNFVKKK